MLIYSHWIKLFRLYKKKNESLESKFNIHLKTITTFVDSTLVRVPPPGTLFNWVQHNPVTFA